MIPKFRAWYVLAEEMIDEILMISFVRKEIIGKFSDGSTSVPLKFEDERNGEDVILMQSTGLFDKNNKEIFEGDVISTYTDNLVIKRDNLLGFYVEYAEYVEVDEKRNYFAETVDIEYLDLFAKDFGVAVEVIGNIYENAEMVREVK
nr:YopX family protein [uncultured Streptococcus sp.]